MKRTFYKTIGIVACLMLLFPFAGAVDLDSQHRDPEYVKVILNRSEKIVTFLNIADPDAYQEVLHILANRYFELNDIYERRDSLVKVAKANNPSPAVQRYLIDLAQQEKDAALYRTHFAFPAALSLYLDDKQINAVKDGMTYGVLMVTYNSTLEMIPSLTDEEKRQIKAWLTEARELAIDAESSNKKHEVFGKYKGRINNYLSARGYNLTKEREEWYKRIEAAKKAE